jgi:hypothetical protein
MFHRARTYLALSLIFGVAQVAGCIAAEEKTGAESTATAEEPADGFYCVGEPEPEARCPDKQGVSKVGSPEDPVSRASCPPPDWYFHPNNGLHGGWIESWRLCNEGGQNFRICTGGYAPVRYWNPSSCGGTVQDYYPQGWSGWAQTGGGCC